MLLPCTSSHASPSKQAKAAADKELSQIYCQRKGPQDWAELVRGYDLCDCVLAVFKPNPQTNSQYFHIVPNPIWGTEAQAYLLKSQKKIFKIKKAKGFLNIFFLGAC